MRNIVPLPIHNVSQLRTAVHEARVPLTPADPNLTNVSPAGGLRGNRPPRSLYVQTSHFRSGRDSRRRLGLVPRRHPHLRRYEGLRHGAPQERREARDSHDDGHPLRRGHRGLLGHPRPVLERQRGRPPLLQRRPHPPLHGGCGSEAGGDPDGRGQRVRHDRSQKERGGFRCGAGQRGLRSLGFESLPPFRRIRSDKIRIGSQPPSYVKII